MRDHSRTDAHTHKGAGLARGPALVIGTILTAIGLALFLKNGATPTGGFPNGDINGPTLLGVETNGWTAWITTAAGALLLFGAAQHLLAKMMSAIVGLALLACAVLAFIDGDVLGIAAANNWTKLGWAVAGVLLLLNIFAPRRRHRDEEVVHDVRNRRVAEPAAAAPVARTTTREPVATDSMRREETPMRGQAIPAEDHNRRDIGTETERTSETVRVGGDPRQDGAGGVDDVNRSSSRFRRD